MFALEREHNGRAWLVWHAESLSRKKRIPPLSNLLWKQQRRVRQTWQEQMAIMDRWAAVTRRAESARSQ